MGEHPSAAARLIRFGPYEFDSRTRELRRNGFKLKLAGNRSKCWRSCWSVRVS